MNEENRKIQEKLGRKMASSETNPPERVWQNISKELQDDRKVVVGYWRMAAALVIVLLAGLTTYNFWNNGEPEMAQNSSASEVISSESQTNISSNYELEKNTKNAPLVAQNKESSASENQSLNGNTKNEKVSSSTLLAKLKTQKEEARELLVGNNLEYTSQNDRRSSETNASLQEKLITGNLDLVAENEIKNTEENNTSIVDEILSQKAFLNLALLNPKTAELLVSFELPTNLELPKTESQPIFEEEPRLKKWNLVASLSPAQNSYAINSYAVDGISAVSYSLPNSFSKDRFSFQASVGLNRILSEKIRITGALFYQNFNTNLTYKLPTGKYEVAFAGNQAVEITAVTTNNEYKNAGFNAGLELLVFRKLVNLNTNTLEFGAGINYSPALNTQTALSTLNLQFLLNRKINKQRVQLGLVFLHDFNSNSQNFNPYFDYKKRSLGLKTAILF